MVHTEHLQVGKQDTACEVFEGGNFIKADIQESKSVNSIEIFQGLQRVSFEIQVCQLRKHFRILKLVIVSWKDRYLILNVKIACLMEL